MEKTYGPNPENLPASTFDFLERLYTKKDRTLEEIVSSTTKNKLPPIQLGSFDGLHLEVLSRMVAPEKAVEIGTLAGFSAVCIARGLKPSGKLWTLEVDSKHAQVARENILAAGFSDQVEVLVGPAKETLPSLTSKAPFDLVFIDADKQGYPAYSAWARDNLRAGGILVADNTFGFGLLGRSPEARAAMPTRDRDMAAALETFHQELTADPRFRATTLPTGEGLTVAVKIF